MAKFTRFFWPTVCGILLSTLLIQQYPQWVGLPNTPKNSPAANIGSFANAVSKASPSVVNIYTATVVREQNTRRVDSKDRISRSLGSGIIMDDNGHIITNLHVINGADSILVMLYDGRESLATVVGVDPDTDLALLKVELKNLVPITVGDPGSARVGDIVLAIGNPYGFGHSVTQGIISATGRYNLQLARYENYIQTDATINQGNSGGALTDVNGNLLGIASALYSLNGTSDGIGLAIPADIALHIMQSIIQNGQVVRGWMGVQVEQLRANNLKDLNINQGLLITGLTDNGPAASAGLKEGDIITHINGRLINDARAAMNRIALSTPGQGVDIEYVRNKTAYHTEIIVGTRPEEQN
jgi:serine protease DegS